MRQLGSNLKETFARFMSPGGRQAQVGCLPTRRARNQQQSQQDRPQRRPDSTTEMRSATSSAYESTRSSVQHNQASLEVHSPPGPLSQGSSVISLLHHIDSGNAFVLEDSAEGNLGPSFHPQWIEILPLELLESFAQYLNCTNCMAMTLLHDRGPGDINLAVDEFVAARDFQNSVQAIRNSAEDLVSTVY